MSRGNDCYAHDCLAHTGFGSIGIGVGANEPVIYRLEVSSGLKATFGGR